MTWEYRTIKVATTGLSGGRLDEEALDRVLNDLGAQGWELVTAVNTARDFGSTRHVVAIFKRPTA